MFHRRMRAAFLGGATALALALALPGAAGAQDFVLPTCATAGPHATLNVGPPGQATSNGGSYGDILFGCKRFRVDVNVGDVGYFYIGGQLATAGQSTWDRVPVAKAQCADYRQSLTLYKKDAQGDFILKGAVTFRGQWKLVFFGSHCALVEQSWSGPNHLGTLNGAHALGGGTWRAAFSARIGTDYQQVRVRAFPF
jgi:hypothetical protein